VIKGGENMDMNLKQLRERANLSRNDVSEKESVALSTIAMWETGKRKPYRRAEKLAKLYRVPIKDIFLAIKIT
jgi:DNA-binding XRE family transcriptional regulator